jgi:hypothetical protein
MKNVTVTLDEETLRWARIDAASKHQSLSRYIGELLQRTLTETRAYDESMRRFLARPPTRLRADATAYPARDDLHDRAG